jgi:hypothetical protein
VRRLLLVIAAVALLLPAAAHGAPRALPVVLQDDAEFLHRSDARIRASLARFKALGGGYVRVTAGWDILAPASDHAARPEFDAADPAAYPQGNFANLDRIVRLTDQAGIGMIVDLAFWAPRWASTGTPGRGKINIDPHEFSRFAQALARRYDGTFRPAAGGSPGGGGLGGIAGGSAGPSLADPLPRVRVFTIWNEPNELGFWGPQWRRAAGGRWVPESPHRYRVMNELGYAAIKAVRPDSTILSGGVSSEGVRRRLDGYGSMPPLQWVREFACVDRGLRALKRRECRSFRAPRCDGFSHHPYLLNYAPNARRVPGDPDNAPIGKLRKLTSLLNALVKRGRLSPGCRRVWITEFGYETNPPDPGARYSQRDQALFLPWADYLAQREPTVVTHSQFLLRDLPVPEGPTRFNGFQTGLLMPGGQRKLGYHAFRAGLHVGKRSRGRLLAFGHVRGATPIRRMRLEWRRAPGRRWQVLRSATRVGGRTATTFAPTKGNVTLRWARRPAGARVQYRLGYQTPSGWTGTIATRAVTP